MAHGFQQQYTEKGNLISVISHSPYTEMSTFQPACCLGRLSLWRASTWFQKLGILDDLTRNLVIGRQKSRKRSWTRNLVIIKWFFLTRSLVLGQFDSRENSLWLPQVAFLPVYPSPPPLPILSPVDTTQRWHRTAVLSNSHRWLFTFKLIKIR